MRSIHNNSQLDPEHMQKTPIKYSLLKFDSLTQKQLHLAFVGKREICWRGDRQDHHCGYNEAGIRPVEIENVSHGPEGWGCLRKDTWVTHLREERKLPLLNHAAPSLPHGDSLIRCQIDSRLAEGQLENK